MARLDEGGGLWYSNGEKSITDKRSAQLKSTAKGLEWPRLWIFLWG